MFATSIKNTNQKKSGTLPLINEEIQCLDNLSTLLNMNCTRMQTRNIVNRI